MRAIERILDQLNRSWGGPSWTGVEIRPLLDSISEEQARAHPIPNAHSILELVTHMGAEMDAASHRLAGNARDLTTEENWRDVTMISFADAVEELENAEGRLSDTVARLSVDNLDDIVPGRDYTVYVMVHGVIQHNLYHSGQISMLKRMQET